MKIHSAAITGSIPARIPAFTSNPNAPSIGDGSIWVNSSNSAINFSVQSGSLGTAAFSAGGIKTGYLADTAGAGNSTNSALSAGGWRDSGLPGYPALDGPSTYGTVATQNYDGSAWADGANMSSNSSCNIKRTGFGTENAAGVTGGWSAPYSNSARSQTHTEEYDGSSWSDASAALPQARHSQCGFGTQNSTIVAAGVCNSSGNSCAGCKETYGYDGSAWSSCNLQSNSHFSCFTGFGSVNAAVLAATCVSPYLHTEEWDGTSWASGGALTAAQYSGAGWGTLNAGILAAGRGNSYNTACLTTQMYDGSSWSAGNASISHKRYMTNGVGDSQNAGLIFSACYSPFSSNICNAYHAACTEEYEVSLSNTFLTKELVAKDGILSSSGAFGQFSADGAHRSGSYSGSYSGSFHGDGSGLSGVTAELFDGANKLSGSSVTTGSFGMVVSHAKVLGSEIGTANSTICGSGAHLTNVATSNTIEITGSLKVQSTEPVQIAELGSDPAISTLGPGSVWINKILGTLNFAYASASILDKTWSAGGNFVGAACCIAGTGQSANDSIVWGGMTSNNDNNRVEAYVYNGTSWSEITDANHGGKHGGGTGTSNAAYKLGAYDGLGSPYNASDICCCTETWDGTSWSNSAAMQREQMSNRAVGTVNSAIAFAGAYACANSCYCCRYTEGWDGSAWSICNDMVHAVSYAAGSGTVGAALLAGGNKSPYRCSYEWDGTSWASGNDTTVSRCRQAGFGTQNASLMHGGCSTNTRTCTECYDGTNWSAATAMTNGGCYQVAGGCSFSSGVATGDSYPTYKACSEEWTEGVANTMLVKQVTGSAYSY